MASDAFIALIDRLRSGDDDAARTVIRRFTCQLLALTRERLDGWLSSKVDPEDLVQSVYKSFFGRLTAGQCEFDNWNSLWGFLAVLAVRKCLDHRCHHRAARRDISREQSPSVDGNTLSIWSAMARGPSPLEAAVFVETIDRLMAELSERDRNILALHLQGYTILEIAWQLGRAERTVRRTIARLRSKMRRISELEAGESLGQRRPMAEHVD